MKSWKYLPYVKQFALGFALDIAYVVWISCVAGHHVFAAGIASMCIALPSILGYTAIFDNRKLIAPYVLGLGCGTVFSMLLFPT